ncbi:MAG: hypothetical protein P8076_11080 [Gammaproteobacteria bacterium]
MTRRSWLLFAGAMVLAAPASWAFGRGPQWTIGRAVIVPARRRVPAAHARYLKLSLHNVGLPGRIPVRIFGRWMTPRVPRSVGRDASGPATATPGWRGPAAGGRPVARGRWSVPGAAGVRQPTRPPSATVPGETAGGLPPGVRLLGRYQREVSLNQTAILEVPLTALGTPGRDADRLEVVIMTGAVVTDRQFVRLLAD